MRGWPSSLQAMQGKRRPRLSPLLSVHTENGKGSDSKPTGRRGGRNRCSRQPHRPGWLQWQPSLRPGLPSVCLPVLVGACGFREVFGFHNCSLAPLRPFTVLGWGGITRVMVWIHLQWLLCFLRISLSSSVRWDSNTHLAQKKFSVNTLSYCCCSN